MGAGATLLAGDAALHEALSDAGWAPTVQRILAADPTVGEVTRIFDLLRAQEAAVREARARGAFPLVLAGGCISATGTVAGCGAEGAVWLDAHADLDTPQDNVSGSMDVMALSLLCGDCWPAQHATIPNAVALPEDRIALLGVRDLADYQRDRLNASALRIAPGAFDAAAITALPRRLYLHVDLDVLDTAVGHANRHAASGGPSLDAVLAAIDATFDHATVLAAALTAYEPPFDKDDNILAAARTIARRIAERARAQRRAGGP